MNYRDALLEDYLALNEKNVVDQAFENMTGRSSGNPDLDPTYASISKSPNYDANGNLKDGRTDKGTAAPAAAGAAAAETDAKKKGKLKKIGSGALAAVWGKKGSSKTHHGLQTAGSVAVAGGAGAAVGGIARLNKLKKNGHAMYLKAKSAGKTNGMSEAEWLAKEVKKAKVAMIAGGGAAVAGGATKGISHAVNKKRHADLYAKNEALDAYRLTTAYIEAMYDLETIVYNLALAESLAESDACGYFDEGYDDVALIEALNYADSVMLYYLDEGETTAPEKEKVKLGEKFKAGFGKAKDATIKGGKAALGIKDDRSKKRVAAINAAQVGAAAGAGTAAVGAAKLAQLKKNGREMYKEAVLKGCKDSYEVWYEKAKKKYTIMAAGGGAAAVAGAAGSVVLRHTGTGAAPWKKEKEDTAAKNEAMGIITAYNEAFVASLNEDYDEYEDFDDFDDDFDDDEF